MESSILTSKRSLGGQAVVAGSVSLQGASERKMGKTMMVKPKVEQRPQEVRFQEPGTSDGNRRQGAEPI